MGTIKNFVDAAISTFDTLVGTPKPQDAPLPPVSQDKNKIKKIMCKNIMVIFWLMVTQPSKRMPPRGKLA